MIYTFRFTSRHCNSLILEVVVDSRDLPEGACEIDALMHAREKLTSVTDPRDWLSAHPLIKECAHCEPALTRYSPLHGEERLDWSTKLWYKA